MVNPHGPFPGLFPSTHVEHFDKRVILRERRLALGNLSQWVAQYFYPHFYYT